MTSFQWLAWWFLPLALLAPIALWRIIDSRRRPLVLFPDTSRVRVAGSSWATRARWIPSALRALAIALIAVCLARPVVAHQQTKVFVEGAALQFVVDRSGSMRALDFQVDGKPADRLDAIKDVARRFVLGGDGLTGRADDLVGLVVFSRFADGLSPLTLDHAYAIDALDKIQPADDSTEGGTAIGDGVALGVERLRDAMKHATTPDGRDPIKSAAIVLLTDGENNAGEVDPRQAADLAATYGIKIYAIGVGTRGMAPFPIGVDPFGRSIIRNVPVSIDEPLLTEMAEKTGGKYFRATDSESLAAIYKEIDTLEKSKTEQRQSFHYTEMAVQPFRIGGRIVPPLLLAGLLVLTLELTLSATRFRSVN